MASIAMNCAVAMFLLSSSAQLPVPPPTPPSPPVQAETAYRCDPDGVITCAFQDVETVTGSRSLEDMRVVGTFIRLISERNRRYYLAWQDRAPAAAYEVVKRVKSFPYLPYGDTYSIVGLTITLNQAENRVTVSYPKKPKQNLASPVAPDDLATYSTKLSDFITMLEAEIRQLQKYAKAPDSPR